MGTGIKGDREGGWRWVVAVSGVVAAGQILGGKLVKDGLLERREGKENLVVEEGRHDEEEGTDNVEDDAIRGDEGDSFFLFLSHNLIVEKTQRD